VCHQALTHEQFIEGDAIFTLGSVAQSMAFVTIGDCEYKWEKNTQLKNRIAEGMWLCEAVLWRKWNHRGHLLACSLCEVALLSTAQLQQVAVGLGTVDAIRAYAMSAAKNLTLVASDHVDTVNQKLLDEIGEHVPFTIRRKTTVSSSKGIYGLFNFLGNGAHWEKHGPLKSGL